MSQSRQLWVGRLIASVWIFHGFFSKILDGIPRHRQIVGRILGEDLARPATVVIGLLEICLGLCVLIGCQRKALALTQTLALVAMNTLEITLARDLLISAPGMVVLNVGFVAIIWFWACAPSEPGRR